MYIYICIYTLFLELACILRSCSCAPFFQFIFQLDKNVSKAFLVLI